MAAATLGNSISTQRCASPASYTRAGIPRARIRPPCASKIGVASFAYLASASASETERYVAIQYPLLIDQFGSSALPNGLRLSGARAERSEFAAAAGYVPS